MQFAYASVVEDLLKYPASADRKVRIVVCFIAQHGPSHARCFVGQRHGGHVRMSPRGDLSFGDSKGTWLVQGLFAYTVGKRQQKRVIFGYQYREAEFKDGGLTPEFAYYGPMAGFNFRF